MSATEIIEEIKQLPPGEQEQVFRYVHSLRSGPWSPEELSNAASALAGETDPVRSKELTARIVAGFYAEPHA